MSARKPRITIATVLIAFIFAGMAWLFLFSGKEKELQLTPMGSPLADLPMPQGTEVGTGWSLGDNPSDAVNEAIEMAMGGRKDKAPDFAVIFAGSGSDLEAILREVRKGLGKETRLYGGTSDSRAIMTNKGFVKTSAQAYAPTQQKSSLAIMTVTSKDITFGVGSADFSAYPSVREASKAALLKAMQSAGKSSQELPRVILTTVTFEAGEEALEGIEEVAGKEAVVLGGTAGGPRFAVFGEDAVYERGISVAVVYTDLPVGWVFEGGFDVKDTPSGAVTKVDGYVISEIDGRPALDVYDEWLGGRIRQLVAEVDNPRTVRDLLTLHPLYRQYTHEDSRDYFLFSHPWPKDQTLQDKSIRTSTRIKEGERVHLSHGTWETLLNRIGNLPAAARFNAGIRSEGRPVLAIATICAGVMGVIPEQEREKMPFLINYANGDAPFIANFTWGEQGHLPGIGNKHGNLLTSFLVIGDRGQGAGGR